MWLIEIGPDGSSVKLCKGHMGGREGKKGLEGLTIRPWGPFKGPRAQLAIASVGKIPICGFRLN